MKLCLNCHFKFEKGAYCPRCSSHKLRELVSKEMEKPAAADAPQEKKTLVFDKKGQRMVYGDTKESWKSFHSQVQSECPNCKGTEFNYDYRHKQKICKKCGEILFMPRRSA